MNIDQIQSILGAEIECGVFESVVVPALDVCRKVAASSAATVSDAASVLTGNQRDAILHHCRLYLDDESGKYNAKSVLTRIFSIAAATTAGAQELAPNQIQVTHTIATADNAATILHALLDSFVEVSAGFPQAKIDDGLANQVRIYLPAASSATPLTSDSEAVDAARYRWARDNILPDHDLPGGFYLGDSGETWDKTIDAARAQSTNGEQS